MLLGIHQKKKKGDIYFYHILSFMSYKYHLFNIRKRQEFQPQSLVAGYSHDNGIQT